MPVKMHFGSAGTKCGGQCPILNTWNSTTDLQSVFRVVGTNVVRKTRKLRHKTFSDLTYFGKFLSIFSQRTGRPDRYKRDGRKYKRCAVAGAIVGARQRQARVKKANGQF